MTIGTYTRVRTSSNSCVECLINTEERLQAGRVLPTTQVDFFSSFWQSYYLKERESLTQSLRRLNVVAPVLFFQKDRTKARRACSSGCSLSFLKMSLFMCYRSALSVLSTSVVASESQSPLEPQDASPY